LEHEIRTLFFCNEFGFVVDLFSVSVYAASPIDASGNVRLRIDFLSTPDWIEINHIEEEPERLLIRLVCETKDAIDISSFDQDGPAFPELASIFKNKVHGRQVLFVIVKWRYYLSGVNAEGYYYEVHAYEVRRNESEKIVFLKIKKFQTFVVPDLMESAEEKRLNFSLKVPPRLGEASLKVK